MSIPIRKALRDVIVTALSDSSDGFNVKLAALASTYSITAFEIDWGEGTRNFAKGRLSSDAAQKFHGLTKWPACLVYTSDAVNDPSEGVKYQVFSGQLIANIDFLIRDRAVEDGEYLFSDTNDLESLPDAIEDAVFDCLHTQRSKLNTAGFHWAARRMISTREEAEITGDGYFQRLLMAFDFERHL